MISSANTLRLLTSRMRTPPSTTMREAIVTAIVDFNRRRRMAALMAFAGQAESLVSPEDLEALRHRG